jgi:hypothetical protein
MPLSLTDIVVRSADQFSSDLEDRIAIMAPDQNRYFVLDAIGSWIWRRIETPARIGDLCALLCEQHQIAPEICERDVLAFLDELVGRSLVRTER